MCNNRTKNYTVCQLQFNRVFKSNTERELQKARRERDGGIALNVILGLIKTTTWRCQQQTGNRKCQAAVPRRTQSPSLNLCRIVSIVEQFAKARQNSSNKFRNKNDMGWPFNVV